MLVDLFKDVAQRAVFFGEVGAAADLDPRPYWARERRVASKWVIVRMEIHDPLRRGLHRFVVQVCQERSWSKIQDLPGARIHLLNPATEAYADPVQR